MGISLSGLGSGFDWKSTVEQLRQVEESQKLTPLNTQKTKYQDKLSSWQSLSTKLGALQTAVQNLKDTDDFDVFTASLTSSGSSVSADSLMSVTAGGSAAKGRYDIVVSKMARAEKLQSAALYDDTSSALNKAGTLTINGEELVLDGSESLSALRTKINELDAGVTASVLRGADNKYRMILTSETEGEAGIALTDLSGADMLFSATPLQAGVDAAFTVDGISMTSTSNEITDAIPGVTLSLKGEDPTVTLALSMDRDNEAIKEKAQKLVDAYNEVLSFLKGQSSYDASTKKTGGSLFGDTTLKSVKSNLQKILAGVGLSKLGISFDSDNKLSLDGSELETSLDSDFRGTMQVFNDLGANFDSVIDKFTDSTQGAITIQQNSIQGRMTSLDKRITSTQDYIDRKMEMLTNQYINLDSALSSMQNMLSMISSQLSSLTSSS